METLFQSALIQRSRTSAVINTTAALQGVRDRALQKWQLGQAKCFGITTENGGPIMPLEKDLSVKLLQIQGKVGEPGHREVNSICLV